MRELSFVLVLGALGCGSSVEKTVDPPADAAVDSAPADAAKDIAADAKCDLGVLPTIAPLTSSEFLFVDADAGVAVPTPTGGDPIGDWRYTKITIYLKDSARKLIDTSKSKVEGTGFGSYTATNFRSQTNIKTHIETTVIGPVDRDTITKGKGTWKMEGNEIVYTPECSESSGDAAAPRIGWSKIDADHARMQFKPPPMPTGDFTEQLVIDLERVK